jgi:RNA polymerase sigma factor (sigma-70 family)
MNIEPKETELIGKVMHLFLKYGIKSLTMDDIARHLGVSKKTIYKYVTDKNDLVAKAMRTQLEDERCAICSINERGLNAIDEFFEVSRFVMELLSNVHPSIHYDMAKYHTEVFHTGFRERQAQVYECIFTNMEKGKKEGLESIPEGIHFALSYESQLIDQQLTKEKIDRLNAAIAQLSPRKREIIYYSFYEGLSYVQIQEIMGLENQQTTRNLMYKAIRYLRKLM